MQEDSEFPEEEVSPLGVKCAKRLLKYLQTKGFEEVAAVRQKLQALVEASGEHYLANVVKRLSDAADLAAKREDDEARLRLDALLFFLDEALDAERQRTEGFGRCFEVVLKRPAGPPSSAGGPPKSKTPTQEFGKSPVEGSVAPLPRGVASDKDRQKALEVLVLAFLAGFIVGSGFVALVHGVFVRALILYAFSS